MTTENFTCPDCEMTSYHPKDVEHSYCGNCHEFKGGFPVVGTRNGFDLLPRPISLTLNTKVPGKWFAVDLETGDVWKQVDGSWKRFKGKVRIELEDGETWESR